MDRVGDVETIREIRARAMAAAAERPAEGPVELYARETPEQARERLRGRMAPRTDRWLARTPKLYTEAVLDRLEADQKPVELAKWLRSDSSTLFLAGPIGTGKTFAAYAAGHHAATSMLVWAEAWNVVEMLDALLPGPDSMATWSAVLESDLLVLDDLAAPKVTDWAAQTMYRIADKRVNDGLRQIVTTNGTYEELVERWGSPTMDRLAYKQTTILLTGKSRRTVGW